MQFMLQYVGTRCAFQSSICLAKGSSNRKLFFITLVQLLLWLPKSILLVLCIVRQSKPCSSQFIVHTAGYVHVWSSHPDTWMFVCVHKAHVLANNESVCCVPSTTCSAVTQVSTFHRRRGCPICRQSVAAFGRCSDSTQNESLVRVGLPFDGHKTVQLPEEAGCYTNTPLKSSSINRHRGHTHCTCACVCESACVCECVRSHSHSHCYLSYSGDLDTLRQRMNISLDGYGGNRGDCFLLEFCSVTAANGILCGVEEIGRISSSQSPGKQGLIERNKE